ncbi:MAG: hypothetical protein FJ267_02430, partial [Planctomycetes bacterium]|nr:hypothetical protein [Planctomycetota bacterium]
MSLQEVIVLIPSHSLEDFPSEQTDAEAASLLNSFAVAWHPELLAQTGVLPKWRRADESSSVHSGQLIFCPLVCDGWLPHGWIDDARSAGATVISGQHDRAEMIQDVITSLGDSAKVSDETVSDFLSLGFCWLQTELLSRRMRNFGNLDEARLEQRAVAAARAAIDGDRETFEAHIRGSFEILLECRERFYPVECYLLDVCLIASGVDCQPLLKSDSFQNPLNL